MFLCLTSLIRFVMKYIFIAYVFSTINFDTFHGKLGRISNSLAEKKPK